MELTIEQRTNGWALIDALLSGEFVQGNGRLCQQSYGEEPSYCCLGVASELERRKNPERYAWVQGNYAFIRAFAALDDDGNAVEQEEFYLPERFLGAYGMAAQSGRFTDEDGDGDDDVDEDGADRYTVGEFSIRGRRYKNLGHANDDGVDFQGIANALVKVYGPRP